MQVVTGYETKIAKAVDDGYYVTVTSALGRTFMFRVRKTESLNPSARGGAYRTEWVARARGVKVYGETRKEAIQKAIVSLSERFSDF